MGRVHEWRELMEILATIIRPPLMPPRVVPIAVTYMFATCWPYSGLDTVDTLTKRLVRILRSIVPAPARVALRRVMHSLRPGIASGKRG